MTDATDDFNRANGALGADWNILSGTPQINTNGWLGAGIANWASDTFDNDQYSEITGATLLSGSGGPACRMQDVDNLYYIFHDGSTTVGLWRKLAGGFTQLDSFSGTVNNTSVLRITATGTNIKAFLDTVEVCDATDASFASGGVGILSNGGARYDSWLGGPIAGGGGGLSEAASRRGMQGAGGASGGMQFKRRSSGLYIPEGARC